MFYQKLVVPQVVPYALLRHEVLSALDDAFVHARLVLLISPAGWGKTTTVATWARAQQQKAIVSWYTLDSYDRDPIIFLRYLITALSPHCPTLKPLLDRLDDNNYTALQPLIDQIVISVAACSAPLYLILDDLHEISSSSADRTEPIFNLLSLLARYAPPIRMAFVSRTTIPGMMPLRVRGHLEILDAKVLAFKAADVIELTNARYGLTLKPDQATALVDWAHGWPAALVLALEEWHSHGPQAAIRSDLLRPIAAHDHLYIFLIEQVFAPLPPPLQRFLVETSLLVYLTPQRCDALRETDDAAQMLAEIQHRALFIESRGDWVHYHDLFRSFLLKLLWESPGRARHFLRRAAELYQQWGEPQHAFPLWLELGDLDAATALVQAVGPKLLRQCAHATVLGWLDQLRAHAPLAPLLLPLQIRIAIELLDWSSAYAAIQLALLCDVPNVVLEARLLEILIANLRMEARASELLAAISLERLPPQLQKLGYEVAGRVALAEGKPTEAIRLLKQALASCGAAGTESFDNDLAHIYDLLGMTLATDRNFTDAMYYLRHADAAWQALADHRRHILTLNNIAVLLAEEGNLPAARTHLEEALQLAEQHHRPRERVLVMCSMADMAMIEARFDAALTYYVAAMEQVGVQRLGEQVYAYTGALRAAAMSANKEEIRRWQQHLDTIPAEEVIVYAGPVALARALAADDPQVAAQHLAQAQAAPLYAPQDQAQMLLLQAQLAFREHGWAAAAPHWAKLEQYLRKSHFDALLQVQCNAVPELLAAAQHSPLARRLQLASPTSGMDWEFYTLGACSVVCNGQPISPAVRPIDQLVMIRLLEAGPAGLPTLTLWEDVWGDQPFSSDALRQALSRIRRTVGLPIRLHQSHCQMQLPWNKVFYDVARFELPLPAAAHVDGLKERIALYRGAFLSHLHNETPWLERRRTTLQRRALSLREGLALVLEPTDPRNALQIYEAVLAEDGCREVAAAGGMRCAAQLGDRALAILIYQEFCRRLIDDLGADPSPTIMQIYQQIA